MSVERRVLVLDDNVDVAESLGEILELNGYQVALAHDGASAVEIYFEKGIEIGLFDVKMPGMNGVEAFLAIKQRDPNARIVMMSGYADDGLIAAALNNGAIGLLGKPFEAEDMLAAISGIETAELQTA